MKAHDFTTVILFTHLAKKPNQETFIRTWFVSKTRIWPNHEDTFMYLMTTKWSPCAHLVQNANFHAKCIGVELTIPFKIGSTKKITFMPTWCKNVNLRVKCTFVEFMTQFKTKSNRKTQSRQIATIDLQLHSHLVQNTHVESLKPHEHQSL